MASDAAAAADSAGRDLRGTLDREMSGEHLEPCPACGGAGGGPFGRAGSAWDDDDYVCVRCKGLGHLRIEGDVASTRPGIVKAAEKAAQEQTATKKRAG